MLLNQDEVFDLLRCPKSGAPLVRTGEDQLVAKSNGLMNYKVIKGYPVLIDWEQTILPNNYGEALSSPVNRRLRGRSTLSRAIRSLVSMPSQATDRNIDCLLNELKALQHNVRVLVVGGATIGKGMECLYEDMNISLVAFDIYPSPHVQFVADAHSIPLPDGVFDAVIVQAVLEHVLEPRCVVKEIGRVLKCDGYVYAETPFLQHVHEGAYDFSRFTDSGHRQLFHEFESLRTGTVAGAGTTLLWALDYFVRSLFRSRRAGRSVRILCFWLQYFDRIIPEAYNIDAASCVYFLGRKRAAGVEKVDIVRHYKGAQKAISGAGATD